jgi:hypothetical protein
MKPLISALLGLALGLNGALMLIAPLWWYWAVPGVRGTGPFNPHFVKDIGAAYLVCGAGFLATTAWPGGWFRGAAVAGTMFLGLHAAIHLAEAFESLNPIGDIARDFAGVIAPALLALWIVSPSPSMWERRHA